MYTSKNKQYVFLDGLELEKQKKVMTNNDGKK
jgi:hypothetical protein